MLFTVAVKSGTNGYYDHDDCDLVLAEIPSNNIPSVGDILEFANKDSRKQERYLVREVKRNYVLKNDNSAFGEWIRVYVINT